MAEDELARMKGNGMGLRKQRRMLVGLAAAMAVIFVAYVVGWWNGNAGHDLELVNSASAAGGVVPKPTGTAQICTAATGLPGRFT